MAAEKKLLQWVKDLHAKGVTVCSICTCAFFLGMAGLLDGIRCTTHWKRTAELKQHFPSIQLQENIL
jgi:transcriptional regulator GlxA family with amidase domain